MKCSSSPVSHLLFCTVFIIAVAMASQEHAPADKIEPVLLAKLENGETANIMISFGDVTAVLESIIHDPDASRGDRANAVQQALEAHRAKTQAGVVKLLNEKKVEYEEFWINNRISVKNATKDIVFSIAEDPEVTEIKEEQVAHILG